MTWTPTAPEQSGFFGVLLGSVPQIVYVVWSHAHQCRAIYRPCSLYPLTSIEEKSIRLWCGPIELPPLPEKGQE